MLKICESNGLLKVERKAGEKKNETRIYPNIPLIQKVVKDLNMKSLTTRNKSRLRIIDSDTSLLKHKRLPIEIVSVSDSVAIEVTRARAKDTKPIPSLLLNP